MGDFSKLSNYNPDSNFKLVRIGADSPVLEVELNEMQDIAEGRHRKFIQHFLGDGITGEGEIVYNEGLLTIRNERAYVNGNAIEITELNLNLEEGEKAYLKVWEQTITSEDIIKFKGNNQEVRTLENKLLDERVKRETSRRIQVLYDLVKEEVEASDTMKCILIGEVTNGKFLIEAKTKVFTNSRTFVDRHISDGSQSVFTTTKTFKQGINCVSVYLDGIHQTEGIHFEEIGRQSIRLSEPPEKGVDVTIVYTALEEAPRVHHSSQHTKDGNDPIDLIELADSTNLIARIEERLLEKRAIDCGFFNDDSSDEEEIIDGGVF